jgi:hypothetical protein
MKAEFDKEIDSLLRRSASRARAASVETGARAGGAHAAHLDADEQSAYAENALPAAARAHYAAHLADCDDCRRGVTQLALAAGIPAQLEAREKAAASGAASPVASWRARLGALFAPRAWRYAVPALVLLLVSAVSLVVLTRRTQREATTIARRNTTETQSARPSAASQPETHHAPQNGNAAPLAAATPGEGTTAAPDADASAPKPASSPSREEIAANSPRTEAVQPLTSVTDEPPPPPATSSAGGAVGAARAVSESPNPTLIPPAVSEAATVASDRQATAKSSAPVPASQRAEQKQGEFESRQREQVSGPRRNEQARNTRAAEADFSRGRADKEEGAPAATAPAAPARRARGADENRAAEDSRSRDGNESSNETRTVAGRKFRRQGGAWIDTSYNAGQPFTTVRRNSEQFRALVADEPELRRIAGALGGEVTVVWKGRAYRIR